MNSKRNVLAASIALMVAATPALAANISCQIKSNGKVEATSVWRNALGPSADEICREVAEQAKLQRPSQAVAAAPQATQANANKPLSATQTTVARPTPALVQRFNDGEPGGAGQSTAVVKASAAMPTAETRKEAIVTRYADTAQSTEAVKVAAVVAPAKAIQPPPTQEVPPLKAAASLELPVKTWVIDGTEQRISRVFTRWANVAGQKLYWEAPTDVLIDQRIALNGSIESAINSILALPAIASSQTPLEACFYPNKVIRITRLGDQKDCK